MSYFIDDDDQQLTSNLYILFPTDDFSLYGTELSSEHQLKNIPEPWSSVSYSASTSSSVHTTVNSQVNAGTDNAEEFDTGYASDRTSRTSSRHLHEYSHNSLIFCCSISGSG